MATTTTIEVFADINCPFTHVGLKLVTAELASLPTAVECLVRAWPLEWVNGAPLDAAAVGSKVDVLRRGLGVDHFSGFRADRWPATTIPALNLAAEAYAVDSAIGLGVSLGLRDALFERGQDVSNPQVLAAIAAANDLPLPSAQPSEAVLGDYAEGLRRGVRGSPDFYIEGEGFFCPSLDLDHDASGHLTADFDSAGLSRFLARLTSGP